MVIMMRNRVINTHISFGGEQPHTVRAELDSALDFHKLLTINRGALVSLAYILRVNSCNVRDMNTMWLCYFIDRPLKLIWTKFKQLDMFSLSHFKLYRQE